MVSFIAYQRWYSPGAWVHPSVTNDHHLWSFHKGNFWRYHSIRNRLTTCWATNRDANELRRHRAHNDVNAMTFLSSYVLFTKEGLLDHSTIPYYVFWSSPRTAVSSLAQSLRDAIHQLSHCPGHALIGQSSTDEGTAVNVGKAWCERAVIISMQTWYSDKSHTVCQV